MVNIIECSKEHLDALAPGQEDLLTAFKSAGFTEVHRVTIRDNVCTIHCQRHLSPDRKDALKGFCVLQFESKES